MTKIALITIHGMGRTETNYASELRSELESRLGDKFAQVAFHSIYYQGILQPNEDRVFGEMAKKGEIDWIKLRKFLLFGFGDAAGLENGKEQKGSVYELAQIEIAKTLHKALIDLDDPKKKVILIGQSLGCQVISNYIWDAQQATDKVRYGIWKNIAEYLPEIGELPPDKQQFVRLQSLHRLYTTGCNIPIFVAAHAKEQILPISSPNPGFRWVNYYDPDDVLGWPLGPLSDEYDSLVRDFAINAGNPFTKGWNPMSHGEYWTDSDVLKPLVRDIEDAISA